MNVGEIILGDYEILDLSAIGGQATVAKARDLRSGDLVAIKQLNASPNQAGFEQQVKRFQREGRIRIEHPNVVDPNTYAEEDGEHYIVFPFIDGVTLDTYVQSQGGRLSVDEALRLIGQVAEGLGAAHDKGITHRDVKPGNILVDKRGIVHIVDFGVGQDVNEATIAEKAGFLGTVHYASPEQIQSPDDVDHRSDLFSLGAVFYFLLTGRPPVDGSDLSSVAVGICQDNPVPPSQLVPSIPRHVEEACLRLLAKHPDHRFQTAQEFLDPVGDPGAAASPPHCPSCHVQLEPGSAYCSRCGAACGAHSPRCRCLACGADVTREDTCLQCSRTFTPTDHRLTFKRGPLTGIVYRIPEGIYPVGRDELEPRDYQISRRHFHVACLNGSVQLQDAGSTNKTYVGGQLAQLPTPIASGQEIRIAGNTAIYSSHNPNPGGIS
jgi:hypothetical protein